MYIYIQKIQLGDVPGTYTVWIDNINSLLKMRQERYRRFAFCTILKLNWTIQWGLMSKNSLKFTPSRQFSKVLSSPLLTFIINTVPWYQYRYRKTAILRAPPLIVLSDKPDGFPTCLSRGILTKLGNAGVPRKLLFELHSRE